MTLALHGKTRKRQGWLIAIAVATLALATVAGTTLRPSETAQAAGPAVVVKPSALNGWVLASDTPDADIPSLVTGPAAVPLGTGSARFVTTAGTNRPMLATGAYVGTTLASISNLEYLTFRTAPATGVLAVALQFDIDLDSSDANTGWQGRLVYEPYLEPATVTQGAWQTWHPLAGRWWFSSFAWSATCGMSNPCNWATVLATYPTASIRGATLFKAGSGWPTFDGNIDAFTIGTSGVDTTYDFEPETACTTVCYANAATGNDAFGGDTPTSAKKTIQAAVNQVTATGTVHVAAGTYIENVSVGKAVTIIGAGQAATIVQPAISNPNCGGGGGGSLCAGASNVFLVAANNVRITELTVDGDNPTLAPTINARNGIITDHTAGTWNGLEVDHVTVQNIYLRGIYASSGGTFTIHDNTVTNVQEAAASIALFNFGGSGTFANNVVSWSNDGIAANWSQGTAFTGNVVTHSGSGVHTDNAGGGVSPADVISGNTVADCKADGYGIWVFVPYTAPTVQNNTVTNCLVGLGAFGGPTVTTSFIGNRVNGGGIVGSIGALVQTGTFGWGNQNVKASFVHNTIVNNETGVQIDESLDLYYSGATLPPATAEVALNYNVLAGNLAVGVTSNAAGTVNTENNWWGCSGGPADTTNCNGVAGSIDAIPWLVDRITVGSSVLPLNGSTAMTINLTWNSNGVQPGDTVPDGTTVNFSTVGGGSVALANAVTLGGIASATVTAGATADVFNACAQVPATYGAVECALIAVYDPTAGFVTGGGWFNSPAGAYTANAALTGKASFGFVSKYQKGKDVPTGNTEFQFKAGDLKFSSTSYEWLVVSGARAQFKGSGTINGAGDYRFMLTAIDGQVSGGGGTDKFRIRIWNNAGGGLVYDNMPSASDTDDPTTVIGGGQIVIHK